MKNIEQLQSEVEELRAEILTLAEIDEITPEQDARLDEATAEFDERTAELAKAEERAAKVDAVRATAEARPSAVKAAFEPVNVNTRANVWDIEELRGLTPEKRGREIVARSLDALSIDTRNSHVSQAGLEDLTRRIEARTSGRVDGRRVSVSEDLAELVIQTGTPEYREAFDAYMKNPSDMIAKLELDKRSNEIQARTALSMPAVAGAVTIPYVLDPTVILTNAGVVSPIRDLARKVQITGTNIWQFNTSAGVSGAWLGESTEVADNTPTFTSTQITACKAAAYAWGSYESIADSGWDSEMAVLFADAKARLEGTAFATGTGSSQPQGIVTFASNATSVYAGSSGAANSADLVAADIYGMRASLSPRWRQNATWLANLAIANSIRQLGTSTNFHAFTLDLSQGYDDLRLLGKPFYEVSDMDSTVVSGSTDFALLHGDMSKYAIVDRVGATVLYQPIVTGASFRPTGQAGFMMYWRVGAGGEVQDAFRLYKI